MADLEFCAWTDASTPTVLVVEDEPLVRHVICEALRDLDINVVEAASADEAWDYILGGARVDLVFTDHRMPGSLSGEQLVQRLRDARPDLPVVLTSGTLNGGAMSVAVLLKPYNVLQTAKRLAVLAGAAIGKEGP